jgi:pimeloyl-ACP methyl ester carboxylesterase
MKKLFILHGALGAKSQFDALSQKLNTYFEVEILEFEGHGSTALVNAFSIQNFANQLDDVLSKLDEKPVIFGYSMGGYVALKYGSEHTDKIEKLVTLGTKFEWNEASSQREAGQLNAEKIEEKVPSFARYLKQLHGASGWKILLENTANMMLAMGKQPPLNESNFARIEFPVELLRGSEDLMVTAAETIAVAEKLTHANYQEIQGWKHPIDRIPVEELAQVLIQKFSYEN